MKTAEHYDYAPENYEHLQLWERRLGHRIPRPGSWTFAEDFAMTHADCRLEFVRLARSLYEEVSE